MTKQDEFSHVGRGSTFPEGITRCNNGQAGLMSVKRFVNSHDREPEGGHEDVDEQESSD